MEQVIGLICLMIVSSIGTYVFYLYFSYQNIKANRNRLEQMKHKWIPHLVKQHQVNKIRTDRHQFELAPDLYLDEQQARRDFQSDYRALITESHRDVLLRYISDFVRFHDQRLEEKQHEWIPRLVDGNLISTTSTETYQLKLSDGIYLDELNAAQEFLDDFSVMMLPSHRDHLVRYIEDYMLHRESELLESLKDVEPDIELIKGSSLELQALMMEQQPERLYSGQDSDLSRKIVLGRLLYRYNRELDRRLTTMYEKRELEHTQILEMAGVFVDQWDAKPDFLSYFSSKGKPLAYDFLETYTRLALTWLLYYNQAEHTIEQHLSELQELCSRLIEVHAPVLARKKRKYVSSDDYGVTHISSKWQEEKTYFFKHVIMNDPAVLSWEHRVYPKLVSDIEEQQPTNIPWMICQSKDLSFFEDSPLQEDHQFYFDIMRLIEQAAERPLDASQQAVSNKFRADMTGEEYELFCMELLTTAGWNAQTTQTSGDFGIDVLARKESLTVVIQCKRYQNSVGISAVQEIIAGKAHMDADYAAVVTNSQYTSSAITLAQSTNTFLLHHEDLVHLDDILKQG